MSARKQQARPRHIPQRTCLVCGTTSAKRSLTRLVRTKDAGIWVDPTGKREGRGAYLCDNPSCWETARTTQVLSKALRTTLTDADRVRLQEAAPREER
ncbi:MAG: YlxR family protein [Anaerolineae bacterium]|nr:YlxR family protein [Anaerolineae bacterium]